MNILKNTTGAGLVFRRRNIIILEHLYKRTHRDLESILCIEASSIQRLNNTLKVIKVVEDVLNTSRGCSRVSFIGGSIIEVTFIQRLKKCSMGQKEHL